MSDDSLGVLVDRRLQRLLLDWQVTAAGLEASERCVSAIVEAVLTGVRGLEHQTEALRAECAALDNELRQRLHGHEAIDDALLARRITLAHLLEAFAPLSGDAHP